MVGDTDNVPLEVVDSSTLGVREETPSEADLTEGPLLGPGGRAALRRILRRERYPGQPIEVSVTFPWFFPHSPGSDKSGL